MDHSQDTRAASGTGDAQDNDTGTDTVGDRVEELLDDELLVEEISIDGMCGVY